MGGCFVCLSVGVDVVSVFVAVVGSVRSVGAVVLLVSCFVLLVSSVSLVCWCWCVGVIGGVVCLFT